jgi:hypothetical protein
VESDIVGVERRLPFTLIENIVLEDQELGAVDVLVYLALAKHADDEGTCWPSLATIGKVARCGRTAALKSIATLEAHGYLKRKNRFRPDGGVTSNFYQLLSLKAEKHPVHQADPPRPHRELAPVHVVNTNYIQSEQDPDEERERQAEEAFPLPVSAESGLSLPSAPLPEPETLRARLQRVARETIGAETPHVVYALELVKGGADPDQVVNAWERMLKTKPNSAAFFGKDFATRWRPQKKKDDGKRECPECHVWIGRGYSHTDTCSKRRSA